VDTGGLVPSFDSTIDQAVNQQVGMAIAEADMILYMVDARDGIVPQDWEIAQMLRKSSKPLLLVSNKADNERLQTGIAEFFFLGLGEPRPISAIHGEGVYELLDRIIEMLPEMPAPPASGTEPLKVAIVGRPNVGKSLLLNSMAGREQAITSEIPGTTRDSVDTLLDFDGQSGILIDTAGIQRRGRIGTGVTYYSVIRTFRAIERADVVLLVVDASEQVVAQDEHIAGYILQAGKGVALVANKWDLVTSIGQADFTKHIRNRLKFIGFAPVIYTSALLKQGTEKIMPTVRQIHKSRNLRITTSELNSLVRDLTVTHGPPRIGAKQLKILYATQAETNPPTFVFLVNDAELVHFSYRRYLENGLRRSCDFTGTPLRLIFKTRGE
jgi:GTP-binding protein